MLTFGEWFLFLDEKNMLPRALENKKFVFSYVAAKREGRIILFFHFCVPTL